ncbi:Hypothetical predicted protein [Podarcis lilfordi]|uniref:Bone marrow stromal antigen 2 n=1 Tax=Podarcis lilfordi TaxID=74358 RepID=A0AA35LNZ2_9SAUR|nr:Hypothetical predicted protein [Podarcis lilfordi]
MGGEVSYKRCPQSPTEMSKKPSSPKWKLWVTVCGLAVTLVLFFTFLALYIEERTECESRCYNHTSSAEDKMTGSDALRAQLAAVNQSLENTAQHWNSCKEEVQHLRKNTSVLEGTIEAKEEAYKRLQDKKNLLQNQLSQLNNSLENYKQQGNEKDKTIQRLKDQLNTRQTSSGMVLFPSFLIPSLLLFIAPGVLCSLL